MLSKYLSRYPDPKQSNPPPNYHPYLTLYSHKPDSTSIQYLDSLQDIRIALLPRMDLLYGLNKCLVPLAPRLDIRLERVRMANDSRLRADDGVDFLARLIDGFADLEYSEGLHDAKVQ